MEKEATYPQWLWAVTAIAGRLAIAGSLLGLCLTLVIPRLRDTMAVIGIGVGLAGLLLGIGLLMTGLGGWKQWPSPSIYAKWGWAVCLVLLIGLVGVGILTPAEWHERPIFALLHLGMAVLPAFLLVSLVILAVGRSQALTWREFILALSGGAVTTFVAFPLEIIGLLLCSVLVVGITILLPGGQEEINRLLILFEQWHKLPPMGMAGVLDVIASPVILGVLALTLAIVAPVIEELGKTLVMGVVAAWRRPSLVTAFLWGATCGLGFAVIENVTNGAGALGEVSGWLGGMTMRAAASGMHMLSGGIVGLGWGFFWRKKRWVLPLAYLAVIGFHGLWNFNVVALIGGTAFGVTNNPVGFVIAAIGIILVGLLALFTPLALIGMPLLLRTRKVESVQAA